MRVRARAFAPSLLLHARRQVRAGTKISVKGSRSAEQAVEVCSGSP